jgi:hypothetical protein
MKLKKLVKSKIKRMDDTLDAILLCVLISALTNIIIMCVTISISKL